MPRIITLTPNPTFDFAVDADFVAPNRKLRCRNPASHPGGGGVNVARAAHRLGADTLAIFTMGGVYGAAVKDLIAAEGVPMRPVPVRGETRIAFHVRDLRAGDEYRFNLPGAEMSADECAAVMRSLEMEAAPGDYVVGSGSLPPMPGGGADFWARAARVSKKSGARFVLDSISGVEAALAEGVFLFRQNEHELRAFAGRDLGWPDEVNSFARELVGSGAAERVVISHGDDGSLMAGERETVIVPVVPVRAHSAVGAGDSFVAALVVSLIRGETDEQALRHGAAAAAATRLSPGTALFEPADVARLLGG